MKENAGTYTFSAIGLGHQLRSTQKAYNATVTDLQSGYANLNHLNDAEAIEIKLRIDRLITDCLSLSASLDEALNQNV